MSHAVISTLLSYFSLYDVYYNCHLAVDINRSGSTETDVKYST